MNPQENREVERRLKELEKQVNQQSPSVRVDLEPGQPMQTNTNRSQFTQILLKVTDWYQGLPDAGKIAVIVVAGLVGFALLRTVLQLVASLFSLAFFGVLLYFGYKFFIAPKRPD